MDNGYRMNIVPLEIDRDEEASAESTLSNSLESGLTVESLRGGADLKLDECTGWTNEKHNSYLDHLEKSFVNQLYSFLGVETQRLSTTRDLQPNSRRSADQFTVLQNGCRQKVNFGKNQAHLDRSSEFRFQKSSLRSNPENLNPTYTMGTTKQGDVISNEETKHSSDKAFTRTSLRNSVCNEYPAQSTAESSGQNFIEEKEKGCDSEVTGKRKSEANNDHSLVKYQVVPVRMVKPRM